MSFRGSARQTVPWAFGLLCALTTGCASGESGQAPTVTARDSAGIHIVENRMPEALPDLLADPEPVLEIGVREGDDAYQLFRVGDLATLSDGRIVVVNGGTRDVRYYSADGTHLLTVGGQGEGPDEFGYPIGVIALEGDTIQVADRYDRVRFDEHGAYVDRATFDMAAWQELWTPNFSEGANWLPGQTLFAPVYIRDDRPPRVEGPFRPRMLLVRVGADLRSVDSLGIYGGIQQEYVDMGERPSAFVGAFSVNTSWATTAGDGTLGVGDSATPEVRLFRPDGSRTWVRWDAEPEAVTAAEVQAAMERRIAAYPEDRLADFHRGWEQLTQPETKPFYHRLDLALDGAPWVRLGDYTSDPTEWLVFDAQGQLRGRFAVPGPFTIYEVGPDYVLGVYRDDTDVEFVRKYRLVGS